MQHELHPGHYRLRWLILVLAAILSVTFYPYLFGGKTFLPSDLFDTMTAPYNTLYQPPQAQNHYVFDALAQELQYKIQTKEAFKRGKSAYWNPHILNGYPQYAECLGNNFDPLNLLLIWMDPVDFIHWETVLELFIAGIGMLFLLRFFGISQLVNLLFSVGYMLNSMFISSAHYRCPLAAFCWIPFVSLMILKYFNSGEFINIIYGAGFLALSFLGGNFQTALFSSIVVSVLVMTFPYRSGQYLIKKRVGALLVIGLLGFCLSAIWWLPSLELLSNTLFHGGSLHSTNLFDVYTIGQRILSVPLLGLLLFIPEVLGNAQSFNIRKFANIDVINFNGSIGFIAAFFAFWGCVKLWRKKEIRPFILIGLGGIVLPVFTPLFSILYHRFFIVSSFAFCIVGAHAFQSFVFREEVRTAFRKYLLWTEIVFSAVVIALAGLGIYIITHYQSFYETVLKKVQPLIAGSAFGMGNESWMIGRVKKTLEYYAFSPQLWVPLLLVAIILCCLNLLQRKKLSPQIFLAVVFSSSTVILCLSARTWFPLLDTNDFPIYPRTGITDFLLLHASEGRFATWRDGSQDPYLLAENAASIYHLSDFRGYESLSNRSMAILYERNNHSDTLNLRLLGLANVKYIVTGKRVVTNAYLRPVFKADGMTIYENLFAKSRAFTAHSVKFVPTDKEATDELLRSDFDGSVVLFKTKDSLQNTESLSSSGESTIEIKNRDNENVEINVVSSSKCILVLTDTYYPGWKCYINGIEKPIFEVNYCMRGVVLDQGQSRVVFVFQPSVFTFASFLNFGSICFFLAYVVFSKRRRNTAHNI